jgi:HlyD family secretion protein
MAAMDAATAEAALGVARAHVEEARARVASAKAYLDKQTVRAPFDGVISEVWVEVGEATMAAGPGPGGGKAQATLAMESASRLFEVIALDDLYVTAPIDEVDLAKVTQGLPARVTLDPWPREPFLGKVKRVASYVLDVEEQNRTVEVEVEIPEAWMKRGLRPGISADVELIVDKKENVLRLPAHAVLEGQRVLVVERDAGGRERAVERKLTIGLENWRACEVLAGLSEGDRVIASAADGSRVKPGSLVAVRSVLEIDSARPQDAQKKEPP